MTPQSDIGLAEWCTLEVGGAARWFVDSPDESSVIAALGWAADRQLPVHILGGGSNVVFADRGFSGLVIRTSLKGLEVAAEGDSAVFRVGAGEPWDPIVARSVEEDCAGLECLSGIPGQVGGTPIQNVGAYGQEVSGSITAVHAVDRASLRLRSFGASECAFGYRTSRFKTVDRNQFVVTRVDFRLARSGEPTLAYADVVAYFDDDPRRPSLERVREAVLEIRRRKGMVIEPGNPANRSVGSFFVNPAVSRACFRELSTSYSAVPHYASGPDAIKVPAAWLIEQAGFTRGFRRGNVGISPFQAQAIVNHGGACADEVVALAADIKRAVWNAFRITIVPEPVFVGFERTAEIEWLEERR